MIVQCSDDSWIFLVGQPCEVGTGVGSEWLRHLSKIVIEVL